MTLSRSCFRKLAAKTLSLYRMDKNKVRKKTKLESYKRRLAKPARSTRCKLSRKKRNSRKMS